MSVQTLFKGVVKFYEFFVKKQLKVFDFKSHVLSALAFLDPLKSWSMPNSVFDLIEENFHSRHLLSLNTGNLCVTIKFVLKRNVMLFRFG